MTIPTYKESGNRDSPYSYFKLLPRNWPKQEKETVGSTRRFFQYCYLLEKKFCSTSRDILNFLHYLKISIYLIRLFSLGP